MSMTGRMLQLATGTMGWHLTRGGFFSGLVGGSLTGGRFGWLLRWARRQLFSVRGTGL